MARLASAFAILTLVAAAPARAIPGFHLIWRDSGTPTVVVSPAVETLLVADLVMELGAGDDTIGVGISFLFDEDLGDELDFVAFRERTYADLLGIGPWGPLTSPGTVFESLSQESTPAAIGRITGFNSVDVTAGPPNPLSGPAVVTLGSVTFRTNPGNVATDGTDVRTDILANGFDAFLRGDGTTLCAGDCASLGFVFAGASVDVPEPSTAILVLVGLVGLVGAAARARR